MNVHKTFRNDLNMNRKDFNRRIGEFTDPFNVNNRIQVKYLLFEISIEENFSIFEVDKEFEKKFIAPTEYDCTKFSLKLLDANVYFYLVNFGGERNRKGKIGNLTKFMGVHFIRKIRNLKLFNNKFSELIDIPITADEIYKIEKIDIKKKFGNRKIYDSSIDNIFYEESTCNSNDNENFKKNKEKIVISENDNCNKNFTIDNLNSVSNKSKNILNDFNILEFNEMQKLIKLENKLCLKDNDIIFKVRDMKFRYRNTNDTLFKDSSIFILDNNVVKDHIKSKIENKFLCQIINVEHNSRIDLLLHTQILIIDNIGPGALVNFSDLINTINAHKKDKSKVHNLKSEGINCIIFTEYELEYCYTEQEINFIRNNFNLVNKNLLNTCKINDIDFNANYHEKKNYINIFDKEESKLNEYELKSNYNKSLIVYRDYLSKQNKEEISLFLFSTEFYISVKRFYFKIDIRKNDKESDLINNSNLTLNNEVNEDKYLYKVKSNSKEKNLIEDNKNDSTINSPSEAHIQKEKFSKFLAIYKQDEEIINDHDKKINNDYKNTKNIIKKDDDEILNFLEKGSNNIGVKRKKNSLYLIDQICNDKMFTNLNMFECNYGRGLRNRERKPNSKI